VKLIEVKVDAERAWLVNEQGERIFSRVLSHKTQRWKTYLYDHNGEPCEVETAREQRLVSSAKLPHLKLGLVRDLGEAVMPEESEDAAEVFVVQPLAWRMSVDLWNDDADGCVLRPIVLPNIYADFAPCCTILFDERAGVAHRFSDEWIPLAAEDPVDAVARILKLESQPPTGFVRWTGLALQGKWADDRGAECAEG
jgi:hypothetical protein